MKVTLIVNPFATRVTEERVRDLEQRLDVAETLLTERRGHATELAAGAKGEAVFAYGGDGLVNEVLNGLP
ncbi:MAG TPA: acylglycerol kinase family protein, partial [Gaiellaceae bacterium]